MLGRLLDIGAAGIIAPRIETLEDAATIARACRFPPRGQRSQLQTMPQYGFRPMPARTLNPLLDDLTIVQIMLETPAGIANADAIAALDGVDLLTIGVNDLCAEIGCIGQFDDPRLHDAIATAADACRAQDDAPESFLCVTRTGGLDARRLITSLRPAICSGS